ncbi:hypothetical protein DM860_015093 [Cuscuta australis]|uniref:MORF/ORRM1/DAG-like MORF domain-containing protein n=1 Tax=Cuscuta australis TaxID=267555 RepID=A0A328DTT6_9ASTE|nr:hypothetical protein DM860_015093 [Cuscuta australis]
MATGVLTRSLCTAGKLQAMGTAFTRSFSSLPPCRHFFSSSSLLRLRPLVTVTPGIGHLYPGAAALRGFATRQTYSSLNDTNPNFSNRPPKETILLDGCDFEHFLVVLEKPEGDPTRDEIIDSYIKVLAQVVGSEEEARMKIYSVSTRHYYAFGALVSEEVSYKIKELDKVRWVLPDSYLDVRNKDYGGEPFIDGQAVPYDPKYHEEWVRNNARANERNKRSDRPRNFDRSRNFDRRQMANPNAQNPGPGQNYRPSAGPTQHGSPSGPNQSNNAPMPNQNSNAPWPPTQKNSPPGPPQNNYSPSGPTQNNYSPPAPSQNNHSPSSHGQNFPPVTGQGYSTPGHMQNYPPGPGQNYPPRQSYAPPSPGQSYAPSSPGHSYAPPVQSYSPPPGPGHNMYPPGPNQNYAPAPNRNQTFTPGPNENNYVPNMDGRNAY